MYEPPEASGPAHPDQTTDHRLESVFGTLVTWAQALRSRHVIPSTGDTAMQTIVDDLLARVEGRPRRRVPVRAVR